MHVELEIVMTENEVRRLSSGKADALYGASPRDVEATDVRTPLPVVETHGRDIIEKLKSVCTFRSLFQTRKRIHHPIS